MALTQREIELIQEKARAGIPLSSPTAEKQAYYSKFQNTVVIPQVQAKAFAGVPLSNPNNYTQKLWNNFRASGVTNVNSTNAGGSNIGQGSPMDYSSGGLNNPYLDQTKPNIVNNTGGKPITVIGSGVNNPLNNLELNSVVAVVLGLFFVRGAFKLLTKFF